MREDEFNNRLSPPANFRGCTVFYYAVLADNLDTINMLLGAGKHEVDKLIGAPPSYVGHKDGVTCPTVPES